MTFNEWFYEIENFSLRSERFYSDLDNEEKEKLMLSWLKAAYDVGYAAALDNLLDDGK